MFLSNNDSGNRIFQRILLAGMACTFVMIWACTNRDGLVLKEHSQKQSLAGAVNITEQALRTSLERIEPGMGEWQVEALIQFVIRWNRARGPAFAPIVASGPNSVKIHYQENNRRMKEGELVVIDAGARYEGFSADLTRTVPVVGKFTDRQEALYRTVRKAQERMIHAVKPGITLRDLHETAESVLREAGYAEQFDHYATHIIGERVHVRADRETQLKPGMAVAIEPGIYLADQDTGIRIEDVVLVTKNGHVNLSGDLAKTVEEIEAVMKTSPDDVITPDQGNVPTEDRSFLNH